MARSPRKYLVKTRGGIAAATVVAVVIAVAATAGVGTASSKQASKGKPIIIGAAVAKTGFFSSYDWPGTLAAGLAIADINKAGGVLGRPLKLITADTKSDRATGRTAALSLIQSGAVFGLTSCDPDLATPAALTFGTHHDVSMSVCAAAPEFGENHNPPLTFTTTIASNTEAAAAAQFAYQKQHWKTAYTFMDTTLQYTKTWIGFFQKSFTKWGGKVVGQDTFANGDASIATQISRYKALSTKPAFIAFCSYEPGGPSAIRQIRAAGITQPIVMCAGEEGVDWLPSVPGLTNAYVMTHADFYGHDPSKAINRFYKRYVARTHQKVIRSHAIEGYDAIQLLAKAITKAKSTKGPAVQKALESFKNVNVLSGPTTYSKKWHIPFERPIAVEEIKGGKQVFIVKFIPKHIILPR